MQIDRETSPRLARRVELGHGAPPGPSGGASGAAGTLLLPRRLAIAEALLDLERAILAAGMLGSRYAAIRFADSMIRAESRYDAVALGRMANAGADLLKLLVHQANAEEGMPAREIRQALNCAGAYGDGLAAVRSGGRQALDLALLQTLHRRLCTGIAVTGTPGQFRSKSHWAAPLRGDTARLPPPAPPALVAALQDLADFMANPPPLPLSVRMALVAGQIEVLMPFDYGSNLLARIVPPLMAEAEGAPPIFVADAMAVRWQEGEEALARLRMKGSWDAWLVFFLAGLSDAATRAGDRVEAMLLLRDSWEQRLLTLRSDANARRLAELALGTPVITVSRAQMLLDVSFQTANAAVATLVRLGILSSHANMRRNRIFVVNEALAIFGASIPGIAG